MKPNEIAARDFLALTKLVQEQEFELAGRLIGGWTPAEAVNALISGAAQLSLALTMTTGSHEGACQLVVEQLAGFNEL